MSTENIANALNIVIDDNLNLQTSGTTTTNTTTCWSYWQDYHYPNVISTSYPVYIQERSLDKGKQAFEIIKVLKDKKMVKLNKVSDFIDLMDALIKIL